MKLAPTRTLVVANLLALAGLAYLWLDQAGQWRNIAWAAPMPVKPVIATAPAANKSVDAGDSGSFAMTLERPLFAPDRRPPPPVLPPPPPPPPDPLADVRIMGLISGEVGSALLKTDGKVRNIKLSQKVGDWTLQSIEDRSVTFARGTETRVIKLEYARLNVPVPVPVLAAKSNTVPTGGPPAAQTDAAKLQAEQNEARRRYREQLHKNANL